MSSLLLLPVSSQGTMPGFRNHLLPRLTSTPSSSRPVLLLLRLLLLELKLPLRIQEVLDVFMDRLILLAPDETRQSVRPRQPLCFQMDGVQLCPIDQTFLQVIV